MGVVYIPSCTQEDVGREPFRGGEGNWFVMVFDWEQWCWMPWTHFRRERQALSWCRGKFASMDFVRVVRMEA